MLEDVVKAIEGVEARLVSLSRPLNLAGQTEEIAALEAEAGQPTFWDDPAAAQAQMQRLNTLKENLAPWHLVRKRLDDAKTLAELAGMEDSPETYVPEIEGELKAITAALDKLEVETLLSGPHDAAPAILEINAGAGGADANDWTSILQRMYLRWSDRHGFKADLLDELEFVVVDPMTGKLAGTDDLALVQWHDVVQLNWPRADFTQRVGARAVALAQLLPVFARWAISPDLLEQPFGDVFSVHRDLQALDVGQRSSAAC